MVEEQSSKHLHLGVLEAGAAGWVDGGIGGDDEDRTRESARFSNMSSSFWQLMRSFSNLSRSLMHQRQSSIRAIQTCRTWGLLFRLRYNAVYRYE